jgi:adenine-specific DNA-methyltransferase
LNAEDGGMRRVILVQVPDLTGYKDFRTISEITKARLRSAGEALSNDLGRRSDTGFVVYGLAPSNFRAWEDYDGDSIEQLEALFHGAETPLVNGWTPDAVRTEVLLLQGFPLDARIEKATMLKKNDVRLVTADNIGHRLWVCLDQKLHDATVAAMHPAAEDVVVCLDSALDDETKVRLADRCMLATI